MADSERTAPRNPAGRPAIRDHLELYLFVTIAQRTSGLSVRETLKNRKVVFEGALVSHPRVAHRRQALRGDALRRRYGEARKMLRIGETESHPHLKFDPALDYQRKLNEFIESVVEVFAGS